MVVRKAGRGESPGDSSEAHEAASVGNAQAHATRERGIVEEVGKQVQRFLEGLERHEAVASLTALFKIHPQQVQKNVADFLSCLGTSAIEEGQKLIKELQSGQGEGRAWHRVIQQKVQGLWAPLECAFQGAFHRLNSQPTANPSLEPTLLNIPRRMDFEGVRTQVRRQLNLDHAGDGELIFRRDQAKFELEHTDSGTVEHDNLLRRLFSVQEIRLLKAEGTGTLSVAERAEALSDLIECGIKLLKRGEAFALGEGLNNLIPISGASPVHAIVLKDDLDNIWIKNLSPQGTVLNGEKVEKFVRLTPGSTLQLTPSAPTIPVLTARPPAALPHRDSYLIKLRDEALATPEVSNDLLLARLNAARDELERSPVGSSTRPYFLEKIFKLQVVRSQQSDPKAAGRDEIQQELLQCALELLKPGEKFSLGRSEDNLIRLSDDQASRSHASIYRDRHGHLWMRDTSTNGSFVNGEKVNGTIQLSGSLIIQYPGSSLSVSAFTHGSMGEVAEKLLNDTKNYLLSHHLLHGVASEREFDLRLKNSERRESYILVGANEEGLTFARGRETFSVDRIALPEFLERNPNFTSCMEEFSRSNLRVSPVTRLVMPEPSFPDVVQRRLRFTDDVVIDAHGKVGRVKEFTRGAFRVESGDGHVASLTANYLLRYNPHFIPLGQEIRAFSSRGGVKGGFYIKEFDTKTKLFVLQGTRPRRGFIQEKHVGVEELLKFNQNIFSSEEFLKSHPHLISRSEELNLPKGARGHVLKMHSPGNAVVQRVGGATEVVSVDAIIALNRAKLLGSSYAVMEHTVSTGHQFESSKWKVRGEITPDGEVIRRAEAFKDPKQDIVDVFKLRINDAVLNVTVPHAHLDKADYLFQWLGECYSALPDAITSHIPNVVLDPGLNPDDAYWRLKYQDPNHTSLATAGGGTLTFYLPAMERHGIHSPLNVLHEMGHEIARVRYGRELEGREWREAMRVDGVSVSEYGNNSPAEDFAEAFAHFAYKMLPSEGEVFEESRRSGLRTINEQAVEKFYRNCQNGRIPVLEEIFLNGASRS